MAACRHAYFHMLFACCRRMAVSAMKTPLPGKSIIVRLYLSCIAMLVIPAALLMGLSFSIYRESIVTLSAKNIDKALYRAEASLNNYFNKVNAITSAVYRERVSYGSMYPIAWDYLSGESVLAPDPAQKGMVLSSFLKRLVDYEPESIYNIFFVEKSGDVYNAGNEKFSNTLNHGYDFTSTEWFGRISKNPSRRMQIILDSDIAYDYFYKPIPEGLFTVARNIFLVDDRLRVNYIGTLIINIREDYFLNLFDGMDLNSHNFFIIDQNNQTLYSTNQMINLETVLEFVEDDAVQVEIDRVNYDIRRVSSGEYGIAVIGITNIGALTKEFDAVRNFTVVAFLIFLLLSLFLLRLMAKSVAYPVKVIKENMRRLESGCFDEFEKVAGCGEFTEINESLMLAAENTRDYIEKAYIAQLNKKNADLYALQSQIRPHFIMNVLETIRMNLVTRNDIHNARAVMLLGRFAREHLAANDKMVTLREELELAKNYMEIISYCFGKTISLNVDIEDELLDFGVLKMILQPLIENSVKHGFLSKGTSGNIQIGFYQTASCVRLFVRDNGAGIPPEKLHAVNDMLASADLNLDSEHIGLKNVQNRLQNHYGPKAKLSVSSVLSEGTIVYLDFPLDGGVYESDA